MAYSTKYKLKSKSKTKSKKSKNGKRKRVTNKRNYATKSWKKKFNKVKGSKLKKEKIKKVLLTSGGVFLIVMIIGFVFGLSYVQSLTEDLPSPDKPFGNRNSASEIYDRNDNLLYRVFGEENSDPVNIDEVPELLKWAFLSAEDVDFYKHPGVDVSSIVGCSFRYLKDGYASCGGSTITQQLVKQTALTDERSIERKIKEVILSLQIERERDKDEILEMYLTVAPEGSNIYGITRASQFYFGKDLDELNLAEMAVLASIPQNPTNLSPTKSANPEEAKERLGIRTSYVLNQMEKYMDQINKDIKDRTGEEDVLTQEMIDEARETELAYKEPIFDINAPHFVFYAQKLLQERNYNDGVPFTLAELETGGYKITTSLDLDYQAIAEEQVNKGTSEYGSRYGGRNAALVSLNPKTGEVLAMAGSRDYFGSPYPEGCTLGVNCQYEPNVNITDTLQSPGSSMKPMVYYMAMMDGLITPGSQIADIPIQIGNYKPKNYEGGFVGIQSARWMLRESRNIPAIYLLDQVGIEKYITEMQKWGYSTLTNPANYGPSAAVGGVDIKLIDHAQAYGVLANEGKFTQHEVILKIEDKDGNVVFEYEPVSEQVADPRGVYLISHILNGKNQGPGVSWDGRDISGKTGTSEDFKETLFATYTPEIVAVGWLGNNDNTPMYSGASGFGTARPWISEFVSRVGGSIPPTSFNRPAGIVTGGTCVTTIDDGCQGINGDLAIADIKVPALVEISSAEVCTDQKDKLAREIDKQLGFSEVISFKYYKMPNPALQSFLDKWMSGKGDGTGPVPTEFCDINRNPTGSQKPWAIISAPSSSAPLTDTLAINVNAFSASSIVSSVEVYLDGVLLGESTTLPYVDTFSIGSQSPGSHSFEVKVYDSAGNTGSTAVTLEAIGDITLTSPGPVTNGSTVNVNYSYSGTSLDSASLMVDGAVVGSCGGGVCSWTVANPAGVYEMYITGSRLGVALDSNKVMVTVL